MVDIYIHREDWGTSTVVLVCYLGLLHSKGVAEISKGIQPLQNVGLNEEGRRTQVCSVVCMAVLYSKEQWAWDGQSNVW